MSLLKYFSIPLSLFFQLGSLYSQVQLPNNYSSTSENFIRNWAPRAPEQSPQALISRNLREIHQSTQYVDGLGRPLQTVIKKGSLVTNANSPTYSEQAKDLVIPFLYDELGRESIKYLPFASTTTGGTQNNGLFKLNPFEQQVSFYNTQLAGQSDETNVGNSNLNWAYSKNNYELSPLSRIGTIYSPGASWVGSEDATLDEDRHGVKFKYFLNTEEDKVRIWNVAVGTVGTLSTYSSPGEYDPGELNKIITIDEQKKQVIEFKDKEGNVILRKVQLTADSDEEGAGSGHSGWMCTYYLYDELGYLHCVIQPEGVIELAGDEWDLTNTTILNEQCFRYEYDARNRMILKKVPGAEPVYMVYDARDRLVMTQDGNQRAAAKWMVTSYDGLNRPVATGLIKNNYWAGSKSFQSHLEDAYNSTTYPFAVGSPPSNTYWELLTETGYDHYNNIPGASNLTGSLDNSVVTTTYTITTYNTSPSFSQPMTQSLETQGMVTWTATRILGTSSFTYTVNIYDDKGRVLQVKSINHTGGSDIVSTQYNWAGQPLYVVERRQNKQVTPTQTVITLTSHNYDDLGRLVRMARRVRHSAVNSNILTGWKVLVDNKYDALGQLKEKRLGNKVGMAEGNPVGKMEYTYNARGWLLGINKNDMSDDEPDRYFSLELGYDKNASLGAFTPLYNGNIAGMLWKSAGDNEKRKYDFSYDAANRLLKGDFSQYTEGSFNQSAGINYNIKMGDGADVNSAYDYNGNIKRMQQWGLKLAGSVQLDDLTYGYQSSTSNKLAKVTDAFSDPETRLGDFKDGANEDDDYDYDGNGNLVYDKNKDISSIAYNHLNLPAVITITGKGTITYSYDATGNKLKKVTLESPSTANGNKTITTTTKYIAGAVFESRTSFPIDDTPDYPDRLLFIGQPEGRLRTKFESPTSSVIKEFVDDYFVKDHLGNTRMVLADEVKQDIYPPATLEGDFNSTSSAVAEEVKYYTIEEGKIVTKSVDIDYPNKNGDPGELDPPVNPNQNGVSTATSLKMYKLKAVNETDGGVTGLGITLKVMGGDKIDIFGRSYYEDPAPNSGSGNKDIPTLSILTGLLSGSAGAVASVAHGGVTDVTLDGITSITDGIGAAFANKSSIIPNSTRPKAFINYIFFDEQFKAVKYGSSPVRPIAEAGQVKYHDDLTNIPAPKNGYVYIYVSNQSQVDVFFDNLQVIHTRGAILEETHYYPFGLNMAGISSKALNNATKNNYLFNEKELQSREFSDGSGLEFYDFEARIYNPQIGRWHQIDPIADVAPDWTVYRAFYNNPIKFTDPTGLLEFESYGAYKKYAIDNNLEVLKREQIGSQGHWLALDRTGNSDVWAAANRYNLGQENGYTQYTNIEQRAAFYSWFQGETAAKKYETRWAGAASDVASAINEVANPSLMGFNVTAVADMFGYSNSIARSFSNIGNRMIFEDVFPKLQTLYSGPPLTGEAAKVWDAMALSQEQNLIQPLYESTSAFGLLSASSKQLLAGSFILARIKDIDIASFPKNGNLMNVGERWKYGMGGMGYNVKPAQMPNPGQTYTDGTMYYKFRKAGGSGQW